MEAHLWPYGPQCLRLCVLEDRIKTLEGKSTRIGVYLQLQTFEWA